jgi:hypothetical protein
MTPLDILRAEYLSRGWSAESPAVLDREGEQIAREEKQDV